MTKGIALALSYALLSAATIKSKDMDVNARDVTKRTQLHWAVQRADFENVQVLLQHGADVDAKDSMGLTPLHVAAQATVRSAKGVIDGPYQPSEREIEDLQEKIIKIMELLLSRGANVDARDGAQFTPLLRAAEAGNNTQVKFLITHGANVSANQSCTPLFRSLANRHTDTAKLLISAGAVLDVHTSAALGKQDDLKSALKKNPALLNVKDSCLDRSPLHWAVDNGQARIAELLVSNGTMLEVRDVYGYTPLTLAVIRGDKQMTEFLIQHGADVNSKDRFGTSALSHSKQLRRGEIAELLRQSGAKE